MLNQIASSDFEVFSAGSHPSQVHPISIKVMEEIGIDISKHTSNHIDNYINKGIDILIIVCDNANEVCPIFPVNVDKAHCSIDDPFRNWNFDLNQLSTFRETRKEIKLRILKFIKSNELGK